MCGLMFNKKKMPFSSIVYARVCGSMWVYRSNAQYRQQYAKEMKETDRQNCVALGTSLILQPIERNAVWLKQNCSAKQIESETAQAHLERLVVLKKNELTSRVSSSCKIFSTDHK